MVAYPPIPPADGDAAQDGSSTGSTGDLVATMILNIGLPFWLLFWSFFGMDFVMKAGNCANVSCDGGPFAIADALVRVGAWAVFVLSVVVSVVLLVRRRSAWYVPVAAGAVMVLCVFAAMLIASLAQAEGLRLITP
jgi:hypothetical protein